MMGDFKENFIIDGLQEKLGLDSLFFARLIDEDDDWSFIIKVHGLIEALCTNLLVHHFQEEKIANNISRLELAGKGCSKLEFLASLDLVSKQNRSLIVSLSELRNKLVHDISKINFSLSEYASELNKDQLKSFAVRFSPFESLVRSCPYDEDLKIGFQPNEVEACSLDKMRERARKNPRLHIWLGCFYVINSLLDLYSYSDYINETKASSFLYEDL